MRKFNKGVTLIELVVSITAIILIVGAVFIAGHFIVKFW